MSNSKPIENLDVTEVKPGETVDAEKASSEESRVGKTQESVKETEENKKDTQIEEDLIVVEVFLETYDAKQNDKAVKIETKEIAFKQVNIVI